MKTITLFLTLLVSTQSFAGLGLYPSIGFGIRHGNKQKNQDYRAYAQAKVSVAKINNVKLLGVSYNIDDQKNDFLMVTPITFRTENNVEMGVDFLLDGRNSLGGGIGITIGFGF